MPDAEPALPELDAALTALEHSAVGQALRSAGAALTPAPAFAQRLETQLRAHAQGEPAPRRGAWAGLLASRSRRFVAAIVALLLLSGCGALALAASGQRAAGLPAPWPNTGATLNGSSLLLVVIAALGVCGGAVYWWLRQRGSSARAGLEGVCMQNLKHFLWRTRSVSLTAAVVLTLTAVFWTLGAGASPFHDNNNQLPVITLQTDTTTTGTTTTGTTTTGTTTTATTTTGTTTTSTTTTGTTTTATTTTGATTTGTTTTSATTTGPGALPAQSNACDQKHPDQGNDTQGGQPGTPGHNNPRCFTTTTGTTTAGSTGTTTTTTTESSEPEHDNACGDKHPNQGDNGNGHNNPHCASATSTTSVSTSATTGDQDQGDNGQGDQDNGNDKGNGDHGNGNGHGNGGSDNPAPAKPVPPSNGNGNGNGGNGGNNGGSHGGNGGNNGNGGGKHK
ncbi:MAG: hypothetical protein ACTHMR_04500 [Thermomicrobiales bacterium]